MMWVKLLAPYLAWAEPEGGLHDYSCLLQGQVEITRGSENIMRVPGQDQDNTNTTPALPVKNSGKHHCWGSNISGAQWCRRTGHLDKMAKRERWVGWKHLSDGHHTDGRPSQHTVTGDTGVDFFKAAPTREWLLLLIVCVCLCVLDALVLRRAPDTFKWHMIIIFLWMVIAALYLWGVWARMGRRMGIEWISGYVLEWMLSMDNLFVFHLVFQTYKTPPNQVHKAVFVGIIGAVLMRLVFFLVVSTLLHAFGWFRWPFGLLLLWSGVEAVRGEDDDEGDLKDTRLVKCLTWLFGSRIMPSYSEGDTSIFVFDKITGRMRVSLLLVVILIVEFSDIVFALDSVSAKVAQIPNQYIAFSSSVMAMYGLRAMFFIVQDLVEMFDLLKYGLGIILVFIGVELMFGRYFHLSSGLECILIVGVFAVCVIASHVKSMCFPGDQESEPEDEKAAMPGDEPGPTAEGERPDQAPVLAAKA